MIRRNNGRIVRFTFLMREDTNYNFKLICLLDSGGLESSEERFAFVFETCLTLGSLGRKKNQKRFLLFKIGCRI
uniref:Uncharacterized protein n=1 Tax=Anguilla anguilla TaxID=7936 RepID=A0A0E9UP51_ANGAN